MPKGAVLVKYPVWAVKNVTAHEDETLFLTVHRTRSDRVKIKSAVQMQAQAESCAVPKGS